MNESEVFQVVITGVPLAELKRKNAQAATLRLGLVKAMSAYLPLVVMIACVALIATACSMDKSENPSNILNPLSPSEPYGSTPLPRIQGTHVYLLTAPGVWTPSTGYVDATTAYTEDDRLHWVIDDGGAWDSAASVEKTLSFDDSPGRDPKKNDLQWFWEGESNRIHVFFKKTLRTCGRVQVDLSVTHNGVRTTPLRIIVNYVTDCGGGGK